MCRSYAILSSACGGTLTLEDTSVENNTPNNIVTVP